MRRNRFLAALLVLCMMVSLLPFMATEAAAADYSGTCGSNLKWTIDANGVLTISGTGAMYNYTGSSGSTAPWYNHLVKSVVIEPGVTSIGNYAFNSETSLSSVEIPSGIVSIGENAFYLCKALTEVSIPDTVVSLGEEAFSHCSALAEVTLGNKIISMGSRAFNGCTSLKSVTLPPNLVTIASSAFSGCSKLENVTMGNKVTTIGSSAFSGCVKLNNISLPSSVKSIGEYAFDNCDSFTAMVIPDSVTTLSGYAFYDCDSLRSVTVGTGVSAISVYTFKDCDTLAEVKLPDSVKTIGSYAFYSCDSLAHIDLPATLTNVYSHAFEDCISLGSIVLPDTVTAVDNFAFGGCMSLTDAELGAGIQKIGNSAFIDCMSLSQVSFGGNLNTVESFAFSGCASLQDVYYAGSSEQKENISIGSDNSPLSKATWHFGELHKHSYVSVVTDPDCENGGFTTYTCRCGDSYIADEVDALGHSYESVVTAPDCENAGFTTYTCSVCGDSYIADEVTSLGHNMGGWVVTREATCAEVGEQRNDCTRCDHFETEEIPVKGHTFEAGECIDCGEPDPNYVALQITQQPQSLKVVDGEEVQISVAAEGTELTYQWYIKNAGATKFSKSSIIGSVYTVKMSPAVDGRMIYCRITDKYGNFVQSDTVTLKMAQTLAITKQPKTTYTKFGATVNVAVQAEGENLIYKWYYRNADESAYSLSSNQTDTYRPVMNETSKDRRVYCVITDAYGNSVQSKTVVLRMAATITSQPESMAAANGDVAKASLKAVGDGLTYKWYYKNAGATKFSLTTSFTSNSYSVSMNEDRDGRQIYCVVTDKYGKIDKSEVVTLSLCKPLSITKQPQTTYTQMGGTAKVTVMAEGDGLTYQWYIRNASGSTYSKSSITSATYSCKMSATSKDRRVYCVVKDAYGNTVQTKTVLLRMAASITSQPANASAAKGKTVSVTVSAAGDGLTYKWYIKNASGTKFSVSSVTDATYFCTMSAKADGRQVYCVVTDKYGNTVKSNVVTLSMK